MSDDRLVPYEFENQQVRILMLEGEPWWVAKDVCAVLGLVNDRQMVGRLDDDEKGVCTVDTLGGPQQMAIVSEPGLYSLIHTSRKPEARKFKRWVTHEVLPSIRKTGGYSATGKIHIDLDNKEHLLELVGATARKVLELKKVVQELVEKNTVLSEENTDLQESAQLYAEANGYFRLQQGAYSIGYVKPNVCIQGWVKAGLLYRRSKKAFPYQPFVEMGIFEIRSSMPNKNGEVYPQTFITPKGRLILASKDFQNRYGIAPPPQTAKVPQAASSHRLPEQKVTKHAIRIPKIIRHTQPTTN